MGRKRKIHVALSGATGRVGIVLQEMIKRPQSGFALSFIWSRHEPPSDSGSSSGSLIVDGVIDFSAPVLFEQALLWCRKKKKPFVSGTTGLNSRQKKLLKAVSKDIPVFYEENMSWGIWLIKNWVKNFAYPSVSIGIEETHHKYKKDKPSGTALKLKRSFPLRQQKGIKIVSYRRGQELGMHRIYLKSLGEVIVLEHQALSRELFAGGALKALSWLMRQAPGFYNLDSVYMGKKT